MPVPSHGAAPLARTFVLLRVLSIISMLAIVGMTANFVSQIVASNISPPKEIVATLSITCLAALYTLLSLPLFYSPSTSSLSLLILAIIDALLLLAFIIISIILGRSLSFLSCQYIRVGSSTSSAAAFAQAMLSSDKTVNLKMWATGDRATCYQMKATWGSGVALSVLFAGSAMILPILWLKSRRAGAGGKSGV